MVEIFHKKCQNSIYIYAGRPGGVPRRVVRAARPAAARGDARRPRVPQPRVERDRPAPRGGHRQPHTALAVSHRCAHCFSEDYGIFQFTS